MPKVNLTEAQKTNDMLRHNMKRIQESRNADDMSKIIGKKSPTTWGNRLKNPRDMTIGELLDLCRYFRIDVASFVTKKLEIT